MELWSTIRLNVKSTNPKSPTLNQHWQSTCYSKIHQAFRKDEDVVGNHCHWPRVKIILHKESIANNWEIYAYTYVWMYGSMYVWMNVVRPKTNKQTNNNQDKQRSKKNTHTTSLQKKENGRAKTQAHFPKSAIKAHPANIHPSAYANFPFDPSIICLLNKNSCASNYTKNMSESTSE